MAIRQSQRGQRRHRVLRLAGLVVTAAVLAPSSAQEPGRSAAEHLQRALHFADLYNWGDAAPDFAEAERLFLAAGDERDALYARLGRIRAEAEQGALPEIAAELEAELENNPLLRTDKRLRMFALIVKGDIAGEMQSAAIRDDWERVQALAQELDDAKWQYRSLGQLGLAAFYDGDLETARKNVGAALIAAREAGDAGAEIRYSTVLGVGLVKAQMFEQALVYFDEALRIAEATPDAGYPFLTQQARLQALVALKKSDAAERLANEILQEARRRNRRQQEAVLLNAMAQAARARGDHQTAISLLEQSIATSQAGGLLRNVAEGQSLLAEIYRDRGDLEQAERFARMAAESTHASGDTWAVPQRLQTLARLHVSQGQYDEADRIYSQAAALIDSMVGDVSAVLDKTAWIKASSEMYAEHFALAAERFDDQEKAYFIVEQVRGRVIADLLRWGAVAPKAARDTQRAISELQLNLMAAKSAAQVHRIREEIFRAEQSWWITPEINILKAESHTPIGLARVQDTVSDSAVILEYLLAEPNSYCLAISREGSRIVRLAGKERIETLVAAYLKAIKAKSPAVAEARALHEVLLEPIAEADGRKHWVVVRDGALHLVPFDALIDEDNRHAAENHTVTYAPSSTSLVLMAKAKSRPQNFSRTLLAFGGIPYDPSQFAESGATRSGYDLTRLANLPSSKEEVVVAGNAFPDAGNTVLLGAGATESAFKRADPSRYRIIHLAVHGVANTLHPHRSALVLLSDAAAGEDGFLQASEIVQTPLHAELVILSACDTAVGPVEGQEGIATLARSFLLAGASAVVSTLWPMDDAFSLSLMRRFYHHLAAGKPPAYALTAAKRDLLARYNRQAAPYYWAGYTFEGVADGAVRQGSANARNER